MYETLDVSIERRVATVRLNRPEIHNAFNAKLIAELTQTLQRLDEDRGVRILVLTGTGNSFSVGADLTWMRDMAQATETENRDDACRLAELMRTLQFFSKPTLAKINGAAYGGGVGLIACCDISFAVDHAKFGLTEVRLGLAPAVISPYVTAAIGVRQTRRWFLTGEVFTAEKAKSIGLVHEIAEAGRLDCIISTQTELLLNAGPKAVAAAKRLTLRVGGIDRTEQENIDAINAELIAKLRVSTEGQEGINAFLDKRQPQWAVKN